MSKSSFEEVIKSLKEDENITLIDLSGKINSNEQLQELLKFFETACMNENFSGANGNKLTLDLSNNNIDDNGAQILASILKTRYNGIASVDLTNNPQITEKGYEALAEVIVENNELTSFKVSVNENASEAIKSIEEYCQRNFEEKERTVKELNFNLSKLSLKEDKVLYNSKRSEVVSERKNSEKEVKNNSFRDK